MRFASLVALLAGCVAAVGSASAQQTVRSNESYCLEVVDHSGASPWLCRFSTYEQCVASRVLPADRCWLNPYLAFQQRR